MGYTSQMKTRLGVHYHIKAGPDMVRLFEFQDMAGPYYDIIVDNVDQARTYMVNLVNEHLPGYIDEEEIEELDEHIEEILHDIEYGETAYGNMQVHECGLTFALMICTECVPAGMN